MSFSLLENVKDASIATFYFRLLEKVTNENTQRSLSLHNRERLNSRKGIFQKAYEQENTGRR